MRSARLENSTSSVVDCAEPAGVVANDAVAGVDERRHELVPRPQVGDPGMEQDDRRVARTALVDDVEAAAGTGTNVVVIAQR